MAHHESVTALSLLILSMSFDTTKLATIPLISSNTRLMSPWLVVSRGFAIPCFMLFFSFFFNMLRVLHDLI